MSHVFSKGGSKVANKAKRVEKLANHHRGKLKPSHAPSTSSTNEPYQAMRSIHPNSSSSIQHTSSPIISDHNINTTINTSSSMPHYNISSMPYSQTQINTEGHIQTNYFDDGSDIDDDDFSFSSMNGVINEEPSEILELSFGRGRKKTKITSIGQQIQSTDSLNIIPNLFWSSHDSDKFYTILMVDPDSPHPNHPSQGEYLHWLLLNVKKTDENELTSLAEKRLSFKNEKKKRHSKYQKQNIKDALNNKSVYHLVPYESPRPKSDSGKHRIVVLIYEQSGEITHPPKNAVLKDNGNEPLRTKFNTQRFINEHRKLQTGKLVAGTFFYVSGSGGGIEGDITNSEKEELLKHLSVTGHTNNNQNQNYLLRQALLKSLRQEYSKYSELEEAREHAMELKDLGIGQRLDALMNSIQKEGDVHLKPTSNDTNIDNDNHDLDDMDDSDMEDDDNDNDNDETNQSNNDNNQKN